MKRWILYNKTDGTSWLVSPSGDKVQLTPELNFPDEHCDVVNQDEIPLASEFIFIDYDPAVHTIPNEFVFMDATGIRLGADGMVYPCPGNVEPQTDKWPILPERSDKQRRDDLIAVSFLLYNINHEQTKLIAQGKVRPLGYNPVEPSRTLMRKDT